MVQNLATVWPNKSWHHGRMTDDPLASAVEPYLSAVRKHQVAVAAAKKADQKRAECAAEVKRLREVMHGQIVTAGKARRRPKDIAALTKYDPERVRQILRAAGVEPFTDHE